MSRERIRRWVRQWEAVERAEAAEPAERLLSPAESIRRAVSLINLAFTGSRWPPPEEWTFSSEDLSANETWVELRRRLCRP